MGVPKTLLWTLAVFVMGWITHAAWGDAGTVTTSAEMPASDASFLSLFQNKAFGTPLERYSPKDRISEDQIKVYNDRIVIDVQDAQWASFTDTNSMDPIIDTESHALQIVPSSPDEIQVGDIVSYKSTYSDGIIIHRVIRIGMDSDGWYAVMRGDNLNANDPEKVRFDQVKRVLIGIIY